MILGVNSTAVRLGIDRSISMTRRFDGSIGVLKHTSIAGQDMYIAGRMERRWSSSTIEGHEYSQPFE